MKVGLLTFHNTLNYGAALQAYALQEAIKNIGADCEIIDYRNKYIEDSYNILSHVKKALKKRNMRLAIKCCVASLFMKLRKQRFSRFYNEHLSLTSKHFTSSRELESLNREFDKFVVGSDQVWNYNIARSDFAYFLNFVHENNKKIAYAPSFGLTAIPNDLKNAYIDNLKRIRYLSVRESYGAQLIKGLN